MTPPQRAPGARAPLAPWQTEPEVVAAWYMLSPANPHVGNLARAEGLVVTDQDNDGNEVEVVDPDRVRDIALNGTTLAGGGAGYRDSVGNAAALLNLTVGSLDGHGMRAYATALDFLATDLAKRIDRVQQLEERLNINRADGWI